MLSVRPGASFLKKNVNNSLHSDYVAILILCVGYLLLLLFFCCRIFSLYIFRLIQQSKVMELVSTLATYYRKFA